MQFLCTCTVLVVLALQPQSLYGPSQCPPGNGEDCSQPISDVGSLQLADYGVYLVELDGSFGTQLNKSTGFFFEEGDLQFFLTMMENLEREATSSGMCAPQDDWKQDKLAKPPFSRQGRIPAHDFWLPSVRNTGVWWFTGRGEHSFVSLMLPSWG